MPWKRSLQFTFKVLNVIFNHSRAYIPECGVTHRQVVLATGPIPSGAKVAQTRFPFLKSALISSGLLLVTTSCAHYESKARVSGNGPSFVVARNCGTGSSCFNADVKALDTLHMVRGANSSCSGLKYKLWTGPARCFGRSNVAFDESLVDDELGRNVRELGIAPTSNLLRHGVEVPLHFRNADVERVEQVEILGMLGEEWRERAWDTVSKFYWPSARRGCQYLSNDYLGHATIGRHFDGNSKASRGLLGAA